MKIVSLLLLSAFLLPLPVSAISVFKQNGRLSLDGVQLVNHVGTPVQLRGVSTHGINWFDDFYCDNLNMFDTLATKWGADIFRFSMYIHEYDDVSGDVGIEPVTGYLANETVFDSSANLSIHMDTAYYHRIMDTLIVKAKSLGVYCIVDWHMLQNGDPNFYDMNNPKNAAPAAKAFFGYISKTHGAEGNVLYEICNEPSGWDGSWANIASYANQIIPVIRANDPEGIIIVGTPDFASAPDQVNLDDLDNSHNVMFTSHIYMDRGPDDMAIVEDALNNGIPVFVTEWGCQGSDGDGDNDPSLAQDWVDFWAANKISWISWNASPSPLSGAIWDTLLYQDAPEFIDANLKESGLLLKDWLASPADDFGPTALFPEAKSLVSVPLSCAVSQGSVRVNLARAALAPGRVKLFSSAGTCLASADIPGGALSAQLSIRNLAHGTYYARATVDGLVHSWKLIR